jgi:hypothetical protein
MKPRGITNRMQTRVLRCMTLSFALSFLCACGGTGVEDGSGGGGGSSSSSSGGGGPTGSATLTWSSVNTREDGNCLTDVGGYTISVGTMSGAYTMNRSIPLSGSACSTTGSTGACNIDTCSYTITGLTPGTNFFVIATYDSFGSRSVISNEISRVVVAD